MKSEPKYIYERSKDDSQIKKKTIKTIFTKSERYIIEIRQMV